jgi:hypothetical protein
MEVSAMRLWFREFGFLLLAIFLSIAAFLVPNYLSRTGHNPPVGVYIAILGLVAATVTFRKDPRPREKAGWILLMTLIMVAEIRNLYVADADQLRKFGKISGSLDATKRGLDATANGINETAKGMKELWGQATGGDSYLYYSPSVLAGPIGVELPGGPKKGSMVLTAFPRVIGHYPISVHVEVVGPTGWVYGGASKVPALEYPSFRPHELARSRQGLTLEFTPDKAKQFFSVFITTPHGPYDQIILVEKIGDKWLWATRIYKSAGKAPIRILAEPGFPKEQLRPDANWD